MHNRHEVSAAAYIHIHRALSALPVPIHSETSAYCILNFSHHTSIVWTFQHKRRACPGSNLDIIPKMWPDPSPEQESRMIRTIGGNTAFHNFHNDFAHIVNPNERRRLALSEIDKVPFGWYHVRAVVVAGIGMYSSEATLTSLLNETWMGSLFGVLETC